MHITVKNTMAHKAFKTTPISGHNQFNVIGKTAITLYMGSLYK